MSATAPEVTGSGGGQSVSRRRLARLAAVQALYQLQLNPGIGAEAVIREAIEKALDKAQRSMGYPGDVTAIKKIRQELRDGK